MPRKRRNPGDEMSVHEMKMQVLMHESALKEVRLARKHSKGWAEARRWDAVIAYHERRIIDYREMIKKEEQQ